MRIGIGITTRNRPECLERTLSAIKSHTPDNAFIVIVDDASEAPVPEANYRFNENVGIAVAKNKCIQLLMAGGADHFFLFDDDIYPTVRDWYRGYIESGFPHLMYIFPGKKGKELERNDKYVAYSIPRGCMLYFTREVVEAIGFMNPDFGIWGGEHREYSLRVHKFFKTPYPYMDIVGSENLFYSMDESEKGHKSSVSILYRLRKQPIIKQLSVENINYYHNGRES